MNKSLIQQIQLSKPGIKRPWYASKKELGYNRDCSMPTHMSKLLYTSFGRNAVGGGVLIRARWMDGVRMVFVAFLWTFFQVA